MKGNFFNIVFVTHLNHLYKFEIVLNYFQIIVIFSQNIIEFVTWIAKSIMINDAQNLWTKCDQHVLITTSVACASGPSVTTSSTDFSFQNLVFWNLFEFSVAEITLKSKSPTFWIQIFSNKFH
jgi:hypothetical protein